MQAARSAKKITTFEEFWPYYLGEHRSAANRGLHYLGTVASVCYGLWCLLSPNYLALLLLPIVSYGPAWFGHFLIEGNRPATFTYPLWSALADFKMFSWMLMGRLRSEEPVAKPR